ncbi:hypothetical protein C1O30_17110 [Dickeya zeae]|nr:hypothetical protein C1O30_17110 [Dickeya zeae]
MALGSARNPHLLRVRSGLLAALARWAGQSTLSVQHATHVVCAASRVQTGHASNAYWDRL